MEAVQGVKPVSSDNSLSTRTASWSLWLVLDESGHDRALRKILIVSGKNTAFTPFTRSNAASTLKGER